MRGRQRWQRRRQGAHGHSISGSECISSSLQGTYSVLYSYALD